MATAAGLTDRRYRVAAPDGAAPPPARDPYGPVADRIRRQVLADPAGPFRAGDLAAAIGLGVAPMKAALFAESGLRLDAFIRSVRLEQARAWLVSNRETRSRRDIATALGFSSATAFSRAFRRKFAKTISAVRLCAAETAVIIVPPRDEQSAQPRLSIVKAIDEPK